MIARYIVDTVQSSRCRDPRKITKPISKRSSMAAATDTDQRGTRRGSAAKAATIQRSAASQGQVSVQWHSGTEKVSHLIKL